MCGIVGIMNRHSLVSPTLLRRPLDAIAHRGPDDEGYYVDKGVALGHRRLSILDISKDGHQPMIRDNLIIVFNGEIYNYIELRNDLELLGHVFVSKTDTEVILAAYQQWGSACVDRFNGMWAFIIYDSIRQCLLLSRDRFGIKPLYMYLDEHQLVIASEIKAILAAGVKAQANDHILQRYVVFGEVCCDDNTFYKGIKQLSPGCNGMFSLRNWTLETTRYYFIRPKKGPIPTGEMYIQALLDSLSLHLRSDVPIGSCLSGGLDSSSIAAMVTNGANVKDFIAITASSCDPRHDETCFAKQVADYCNLNLHIVVPTQQDFSSNIESCLYAHDEPVGGTSIFMQYCVMRTARELGIKVMLDGQGADEALVGYVDDFHVLVLDMLRRGKFFHAVSELYKMSSLPNTRLLRLLGRIFLGINSKASNEFCKHTLQQLQNHYSFLKKDCLPQCVRDLNIRQDHTPDPHLIAHQITQLLHSPLQHLLKNEDRNSMAHSIEARVPFVEYRSIEMALSLPSEVKFQHGFSKYPLRLQADMILPRAIAWRRDKIGFASPERQWILHHLPVMRDKVASSSIMRRVCRTMPELDTLSDKDKWRFYNIAVWEDRFNVCL